MVNLILLQIKIGVMSMNADVPRALEAVDGDHPHGTPGYKNNGYSVLQQHIAFFDINKDGIIYPWETFQGIWWFLSKCGTLLIIIE